MDAEWDAENWRVIINNVSSTKAKCTLSFVTVQAMTVKATNGTATYSGSATNGGAKVTVTEPTSGYTISYGTAEGTYNLTSIPTYTDAGTYTVYYQVTADGYKTTTGSLTITINKASAKYTAPTSKTLTYTGSTQTLITAGSSTTGTMYYKLGSSGTWSTSLPTASAKGAYIVYYKVVSSNSNYNDLEQQSVTSFIAANTKSTIITLMNELVGYDTSTTALAYDGTTDNNLRYIGSNPNNYICFDTSCTAGKWRIIGVMNNMTVSGSSSKQSLVKVIRADSVGSYAFDSSKVNDWSSASLQTNLNSGTLYSTYISSINSKFATVVWNLGGISSTSNTTSTFYTYERGTTVYSGHAITWTGKIGLMYPSDYGYATSGGSTSGRSTCLGYNLNSWSSYSQCYSNDYLYNSSTIQWTLSPDSSYSNRVFYVSTGGGVGYWDASSSFAFRPVGYLISTATTISAGDGSSSSPYIIG